MSFILDALKKLEQKHRKDSVPDLMTVHIPEPQETKKRLLWHYLLLVSLLLNIVILTALLRPWESEEKIILAKSSIEQGGNSPDVNLNRKYHETDNKETIRIETKSNNKKSVSKLNIVTEERNTDTIRTMPENQSLPAETHGQETVPDKFLPTHDSTTSPGLNPTDQELKILRNKMRDEKHFTAKNHTSAEHQLADMNRNKSEQGVPELGQLPSDIREELPDITITGHVYSNSLSSRIVNINGNITREGETVTTGLKVEEITVSGIIFNYQGLRFYMRAF